MSELYIPIGGEIVAVNEALDDSPELINEDPYGGWIIEVKPNDIGELDKLLDREAYLKLLKAE